MNMQHSLGLLDLLVFGAVALAALMTVAWSLSPTLRQWMERPKHRFQDNLRNHEKSR